MTRNILAFFVIALTLGVSAFAGSTNSTSKSADLKILIQDIKNAYESQEWRHAQCSGAANADDLVSGYISKATSYSVAQEKNQQVITFKSDDKVSVHEAKVTTSLDKKTIKSMTFSYYDKARVVVGGTLINPKFGEGTILVHSFTCKK
jgi:hypothetical protein